METFDTSGAPVLLGPMPVKGARASKRELLRYKGFLMRACDAPAGDDYAHDMLAIFNRASIRLEEDGDASFLVIDHNPLVRAMESLTERSANE
jgi:hypothetical protein